MGFLNRCKMFWFNAVTVGQVKLFCMLFARLRGCTGRVITAQMGHSKLLSHDFELAVIYHKKQTKKTTTQYNNNIIMKCK